MAAPAGTERSRPAASSAAGARVRQRSTSTPPPPTSSAPTAVKRARRRGVQVFEVLETRLCGCAARSTFALRVGWAVSRFARALVRVNNTPSPSRRLSF